MDLNRGERDWYRVKIDIDPPLDGTPQASFDDGATWEDGAADPDVDGAWRWLLAGPAFNATAPDVDMNAGDTTATITAEVVPQFRIKDNPVVDIEVAPDPVYLVG